MGNEIVMFRHEKTFVHQTAFAVQINSDLAAETIEKIAGTINNHVIERAGERLFVESVLINDMSKTAAGFKEAAIKAAEHFKGAIVLKSSLPESLIAAADSLFDRVPLLHAVTQKNIDVLGKYVCVKKLPVVISGENLDGQYVFQKHYPPKGTGK
jgi:acetyl-CoA decarbonylase/synthase complex subunit gamma